MNLSPLLIQHFVDGNGNALVGGLLYTYAAGTSTPQATYTDSTGGTPNANPVLMNARGEADVWLNPALSYKFTLTDRYGTLIWTKDNVPGSVAAIPAAQYFGVDSGAANAYVVTLSGFVGTFTPSTGTVVEFYATNANTGASTLNVNSSGAVAILSQYGTTLSGGELQTSAPTWAQWNGSAWQIVTGISPACVRTAAEIAASVTPSNYA